jgi:hypothetical protein
MKNFYFLCSLPRAGNTLLSSLLNQNKSVLVSPYSIVPNIAHSIISCKEHLNFKSFPEHTTIDNVVDNLLFNYYQPWKADNIIDRGPWGHEPFYSYLKEMVSNRKFVILYRPILEVLASIVKLDKPKDPVQYCDNLMTNSFVSEGYYSIKNLIKQKENYKVFYYDDLVINPYKVIKNICSFLNIKYQKPNLKKINQYNVNTIYYDDSHLKSVYHKIRTDNISKNKIIIKKILPKEIINRYKSWDIKF